MDALASFKVDRYVCETRMPTNYLFWDYSGRLWTSLARVFPEMKFVNANPGHTEFEVGGFLLVAEPGVLRATANGSVGFDDFLIKATEFFDVSVELLSFEVFDRVGYRTILVREYPSMPEAAEAFKELGLLSVPRSPIFGLKAVEPSGFDVRITWDSDDVGILASLRTEKRVVEPIVPWEIRNQVMVKGAERFLLVIDVDRFTRKKLNRDQLGFNEWISGSNRIIRKSISQVFLNE